MHWIWAVVMGWVCFMAGYVVRAVMEGMEERYPELPEDAAPYRPMRNESRFVPRARGD